MERLYDKTFPVRFLSFLIDVEPSCPMGYEELQYLRKIAKTLLEHQLQNPAEGEGEYLERINAKDLLKNN